MRDFSAAPRSSAPGPAPNRTVSTGQNAHVSTARSLVEALVLLALAVILFRTFEVEGYLISTGSMAPCLLGYHKQVTCPSCGCHFAFGAADDEPDGPAAPPDRSPGSSADVIAAGRSPLPDSEHQATCPNCGFSPIDTRALPLNPGDQLLVSKNAYLFRSPRRWEVAVFRNPNKPTQAYVKRVVGLPNETVEIRDGDIYIDGLIQRKNLEQQYGTRILVHDNDFKPASETQSQPHWDPQPASAPWTKVGRGFEISAADAEETAWLDYRHWIRSGGFHQTSVPLDRLPKNLQNAGNLPQPVRYDPARKRLATTGVMTAQIRDRLLALSDDADFTRGVGNLFQASRLAPITDTYAYNPSTGGVPPVPVRDLMVAFDLHIESPDGRLIVEMTDGWKNFRCVITPGDSTLALFEDESPTPVRTAKLERPLQGRTVRFEMSLFDRQVLVALDKAPALEPWPFLSHSIEEPTRRPVRIGAQGFAGRVDSLRLYRDVYYTHKGEPAKHKLGQDEYFMLGDNSPVSFDSRCWRSGAVVSRLFLGKPFIVHLPSRPGKIQLGGRTTYIRIPDLSRIRYIR